MKILVGTDFSEAAAGALEVATTLARRLGDELVLVHALEAPAPVTMVGGEMTALQFTEWLRKPLQLELDRMASEVRARGTRVEAVMREGPVHQQLLDVGRQVGARMIVLASHGRSATDRLLLGSVADRVVRHADRPVLVVGPDPKTLNEALTEQRPMRLAVAVDTSRASDAAVRWTREWCGQFKTDVTFMSTYWPPAQYERLGLTGFRSMYEPDPDVVSVLEDELRRKIGVVPGEGSVRVVVQPSLGRPAEPLAQEADKAKADLLVVGTHGRSGLRSIWPPSTAVGVVHTAHTSVLCVPQKTLEGQVERPPRVRKVLAVTDLSREGNLAVAEAYALCPPGGMVDICHVVTPPVGAQPVNPETRADVEKRLRALIPADAIAAGITSQVAVVEGFDVGKAICQTSERLGVDVIVLSARRKPRFVLGGVAHEVLTGSRRPVTLVHGSE
ncbi:MAG: universal stress protein [Myxococcota bacterium]